MPVRIVMSDANGSHVNNLTVDSNINNISTGLSSGDHTRDGNTGSIMGVNMDGEVWVRLSNSADEPV